MSKGGSMHQKHPPAKVATSRPASGGGRASCAAAGSPDTVAPSPSGSVSRRAPRRGARRDVFAPRAPFAPDPDDALAWVTVTEALDLPVQAPALLPLIPLVVSIGAIGKKKKACWSGKVKNKSTLRHTLIIKVGNQRFRMLVMLLCNA